MICPTCQGEIPSGMNFCGRCGERLPQAPSPALVDDADIADIYRQRRPPSNLALILLLVLVYPIGVFVMWSRSRWSPTVKCAVSAMALLFVAVLVAVNLPDPDSGQAAAAASSSATLKPQAAENVTIGTLGYLYRKGFGSLPLGVTNDALSALEQSSNAKDDVGVDQLYTTGKCVLVGNGTRALLIGLDPWSDHSEVRIKSGPYLNRVLWVESPELLTKT